MTSHSVTIVAVDLAEVHAQADPAADRTVTVAIVVIVQTVANVRIAANVRIVANVRIAVSAKIAENARIVESVRTVENARIAVNVKIAENAVDRDRLAMVHRANIVSHAKSPPMVAMRPLAELMLTVPIGDSADNASTTSPVVLVLTRQSQMRQRLTMNATSHRSVKQLTCAAFFTTQD